MKSALLFRLGGLGDLLVTLPSLNLLRRAFPGTTLDLVCRKEYGELLRESGVVDTAFSADDATWLPLFADSLAVSPEFEDRVLSYDLVIGWFQRDIPKNFERSLSAAKNILTRAINGRHQCHVERSETSHGCRKNEILRFAQNDIYFVLSVVISRFFVYDPASNDSVSRYFFKRTGEFAQGQGVPVFAFEDCCLLPRKEARSRTKHAVVHPGSGSAKKCWPLERFLEAISVLRQYGFTGTVVTGEAEERLGGRLKNFAFPPGWSWLRRPSLKTLAGLLQFATLYIGNDSGVTHLAAACGTNVIALFKKELEMPWKPFGKTTVLSAENVEDIPVSSVTEAVLNIAGSDYP